MAECACNGCGATAAAVSPNAQQQQQEEERRQSPPRFSPSDMEFAHSTDEFSTMGATAASTKSKTKPNSGNSFVPQLEPELESVRL
jgi:hypothetical protein